MPPEKKNKANIARLRSLVQFEEEPAPRSCTMPRHLEITFSLVHSPERLDLLLQSDSKASSIHQANA